jgi:hypothetical protein
MIPYKKIRMTEESNLFGRVLNRYEGDGCTFSLHGGHTIVEVRRGDFIGSNVCMSEHWLLQNKDKWEGVCN